MRAAFDPVNYGFFVGSLALLISLIKLGTTCTNMLHALISNCNMCRHVASNRPTIILLEMARVSVMKQARAVLCNQRLLQA